MITFRVGQRTMNQGASPSWWRHEPRSGSAEEIKPTGFNDDCGGEGGVKLTLILVEAPTPIDILIPRRLHYSITGFPDVPFEKNSLKKAGLPGLTN